MPESFAMLDNQEWDSWISHFKDCAVINSRSNKQKVKFLAIAWGFLAPASKFSNRHAKGAGGAGLKNCRISPVH